MPKLDNNAISDLKAKLRGRIIEPADQDYNDTTMANERG